MEALEFARRVVRDVKREIPEAFQVEGEYSVDGLTSKEHQALMERLAEIRGGE